MKEKWDNLEIFHQSVIISSIYSLIAIIISSILILVNSSFIYGTLIGVGLLFLSYLLIWFLWYKIPKIQTVMAKCTAWLSPLIRILLFLSIYLTIIFTINGEMDGLDKFLEPVNTFSLLATYTIPMFSYFTIGFVDMFLNRQKKKVGEK